MIDSRLVLDKGVSVGEGIELPLRWVRPLAPASESDVVEPVPNPDRPPVLLVHGASAQHKTFCIPRGRSLADFLWEKGYEPWLLDWRGSLVVTDSLIESQPDALRDELDFDKAEIDLFEAIKRIRALRGISGERVHVVAHCMGAGVLAQAIARGTLHAHDLGHVVLLTLGLFYETPLDGKIKSQFRVLDRLWDEGVVSMIDPRHPEDGLLWPPTFSKVYEEIGARWRPHPQSDGVLESSHALCNRISFMYGVPYRHGNLVEDIHGLTSVDFFGGCIEPRNGERLCAVLPAKSQEDEKPLEVRLVERSGFGFVSELSVDSGSWHAENAEGTLYLSGSVGWGSEEELELWADDQKLAECLGTHSHQVDDELSEQFGGIPLRMYLHGAQNVRRGWAGQFVDSNQSAASRPMLDRSYVDEKALGNFREVLSVALITGAENQLWHRDSVDRMYQWLMNDLEGAPRRNLKHQVKRHVLSGYAHQDLLWGKNAWADVFPYILDGLGGPGNAIEIGASASSEPPH